MRLKSEKLMEDSQNINDIGVQQKARQSGAKVTNLEEINMISEYKIVLPTAKQ